MSGHCVCPVCWQPVLLSRPSGANRFVWTHEDKAGNRCPMSGHPLPLSVWEAAA